MEVQPPSHTGGAQPHRKRLQVRTTRQIAGSTDSPKDFMEFGARTARGDPFRREHPCRRTWTRGWGRLSAVRAPLRRLLMVAGALVIGSLAPRASSDPPTLAGTWSAGPLSESVTVT